MDETTREEFWIGCGAEWKTTGNHESLMLPGDVIVGTREYCAHDGVTLLDQPSVHYAMPQNASLETLLDILRRLKYARLGEAATLHLIEEYDYKTKRWLFSAYSSCWKDSEELAVISAICTLIGLEMPEEE